MKINSYWLAPLLIATTIFTSCEKWVEVEVDENEHKIVVMGVLNPDSSFVVHLERSFSRYPLDTDLPVEQVQAKLFENGQYLTDLLHIRDGFYGLPDFYPAVGNKYQIEISSGILEPVTCETQIPEPCQFLSIDTTMEWRRANRVELSVSLGLTDPVGEENYYALRIYRTQHYYDHATETLTDSLIDFPEYVRLEGAGTVSDHIVMLDIGADTRFAEMLFLTDLLFDGQEVNLDFNLRLHSMDEQDSVALDFDLFQVSKSYYQFAESYRKYLSTRSNPFAEPVQVFNNVSGGLGLFTSLAGVGKRIVVRNDK